MAFSLHSLTCATEVRIGIGESAIWLDCEFVVIEEWKCRLEGARSRFRVEAKLRVLDIRLELDLNGASQAADRVERQFLRLDIDPLIITLRMQFPSFEG